MTEDQQVSVVEKMKASFKDNTDAEMKQLMKDTITAFEITGGDWLTHLMQKSIINNEIIRRGIKMKSASS